MTRIVLLDAGPLGMVSHPKAWTESHRAIEWVFELVATGTEVLIPEIADYEVRRELLRAKRFKGVQRLNELKRELGFLPLTTDAMLLAAQLWADARNRGTPTADDSALDADVILAAQAKMLLNDETIIATTNVRHLERFAAA